MLPHRRASGAADLTAYIYLLRWDTRLVVSDVDGTITRSDLLGHVLPTLGVDWSHPGITQLFHNIDSNGYQIMFLSSRCGGFQLGLAIRLQGADSSLRDE
jgi:phosphatidate phosphatase LPIN